MRTHICQQQRAPLIRLFPLLCMRSSFRWFNSPDTHVWVFDWFVAATEGMGLGFRACMFRCWLISFTKQINNFRITSDVCVFTFQPTQIGGCLSQLIYCKTNIEQNEH